MIKTTVHISSDLEPLLPRYVDNRRADIVLLRQSIASANFEQIRSLGHTMKGSGTSFGLDAVSDFGRTLEEAAKSSNLTQIEATIQEFDHFMATLEIIFVDDMP